MKNKAKAVRFLSVFVILSMLIAPMSAISFAASPVAEEAGALAAPKMEVAAAPDTRTSPTGLYIVRLTEPSLAAYSGGINGFEATSPSASGSPWLDVSAPSSVAYRNYLDGRHDGVIKAMEAALGRSIEVRYQYLNVLNGMAVALSAAEAAQVAKLPGVLSVTPDVVREMDTEVSVDFIGAPEIWNGNTISDVGTQGEGVIVGVIDSGVNSDHPSFATTGGDGYVHTNPYGSGNSAPGDYCNTVADICTDKLIGTWVFNGTSPEDNDGHGSHTMSTAAGNVHTATITVGPNSFDLLLKGVAPHANTIAYKVCNPGCPSSATVSAVDQAITDRSNAGGLPMVLNYSISGSDAPWSDPTDLAFLDAFNAGLFVSASAGNTGPGAGTTAKTGGWNQTVGASTINRVIANTLDVTGPGTVPGDLTGLAAVTGTGPAIVSALEDNIIWADDIAPGNGQGCNAFPAGAFAGAMALIQRGGCTFAVKVENATAAGAVAVVVFNNVGGPPIVMGALETTTIPAVMLDLADGLAVQAWASANPGTAMVRINAETSYVQNDAWEDIMAGFSSRGPSQFNTLKPDITAPGVNILAAYCCGGGEYTFLQGTSMSSPHGAGSAALMMALHPTWSPVEIKSALATTALTNPVPLNGSSANIFKEDGTTAADWFDMGGGRVDLGAAAYAGLVLDETYTNFVNANPAIGGDPRTLNLHGLQDWDCSGICSFVRTVTNPLPYAVAWNVTTEAPAGVTVTVSPSNFTLPANGSQVLDISVNNSGAPGSVWQFANIHLTPSLVTTPVSEVSNDGPVFTFTSPLPDGAVETVNDADAPNLGEPAALTDFELPSAVLYDNGPLVTHPGAGAGGADVSRVQNVSLGLTTLGFGHQIVNSNRVADDFTITDPTGWDIDEVIFYAYQTGSSTTSSINNVNLRIWDGPPNAGGTVIWGDTTTNRLSNSIWSNIYRDAENTVGDTTRPIMANTATVGVHLGPGTYWLDWQAGGTLASGPWAPPITVLGQTVTGNGLQSIAGTWGAANDGGLLTQQGLPFTVVGSVSSGEGNNLPAAAHLPVAVFNPGAPAIGVSPDSLSSSQGLNQTVEKTLTISNLGSGLLNWSIFEDQTSSPLAAFWSDNFDSYPTGQDLHGVGGWKGWDNSPGATAFTTDAQALSAPNSVDIAGASDLVHEYVGATSGQWTYTAWQYIPSSMTGTSYFILLNTYADGGPNNWSVQVNFNTSTGLVVNDGASGGTLALVTDQWVEIRVEINLDNDTQSFFYNNQLLFAGSWTNEVSGAGALNIGAVDMFANGASSVYYDDLSLVAEEPPPAQVCDFPTDISWASVTPSSGSTLGGSSDDVTVSFNSTGLTPGVYTGTLCVESNDLSNPLVLVPLTLDVLDQQPPSIEVSPDSLSSTQSSDTQVTVPLNISNVGQGDLNWSITEDDPGTSSPTGPVANPGLTLSGSGSGGVLSADYRGAGVLLYDQTSNPGTQAINSQEFEAAFTDFNNQGADDFVIPASDGAWTIDAVFASGFYFNGVGPTPFVNVYFYADNGGLPGAELLAYDGLSTFADVGGALTVDLSANPAILSAGTYWVSVQADMDFGVGGQWGWLVRTTQSNNAAAWRNPGNGFATGCIDWANRVACGVGVPDPDQIFQLFGQVGGGGGQACSVPEDIPWVSVSPTSGTTSGGSTDTVQVTFDSTGLSTGVYTGTLCVSSNDSNNPLVTVPLSLTVEEVTGGAADLSIIKTAPEVVTKGDTFTYALEVTNNGPGTAFDTVVTDKLPGAVTFVSASAGCSIDNKNTVTCDLGNLAPGSSVTVQIVVTADVAGRISNTASVTSNTVDPNTRDNRDRVSTLVLR